MLKKYTKSFCDTFAKLSGDAKTTMKNIKCLCLEYCYVCINSKINLCFTTIVEEETLGLLGLLLFVLSSGEAINLPILLLYLLMAKHEITPDISYTCLI